MNPPPKHRARRHNERRRRTIINHTHPPIIIHPTLVFIPNTPFEPVQRPRARLNSRQKILRVPPSRTLFPRPDARILPRTIRITKPPFNFINIRPRLARPRAHGGQTFIKISQQPKPRRVALVKVPHRVPFASSLRSRAPVGVGASQRARTNEASFAARGGRGFAPARAEPWRGGEKGIRHEEWELQERARTAHTPVRGSDTCALVEARALAGSTAAAAQGAGWPSFE